MVDQELLEAVVTGLKGELDSVTVYSEAAERSSGEVADFFRERAAEEKRHYNWLLAYHKELSGGAVPAHNLAAEVFAETKGSPLITPAFLKRIGESQYLVTAVAAATLLEFGAVAHYRRASEKAQAPALRDFFAALSSWEDGHYRELLRIQDESRQYWFEAQRFEPF